MAEPQVEIALYVHSVEGRAVRRWGSSDRNALVGAVRNRVSDADRKAGVPTIVWQPERVVAIAATEYGRFRREYDRALKSGSLVQVDKAAHDAWLAAQAAREAEDKKARVEQAKADAKRAAKEAKSAGADATAQEKQSP